MLKATQELVLDKSNWKAFQEMVPEKKALYLGLPLYQQEIENEYVVSYAPSVLGITVDAEPTKIPSW